MPWHIVSDHPECSSSEPYAVVKDDDGEVEGCHVTREGAETQLAALYASEEESMSDTTVNFDEITRRVFGEPSDEDTTITAGAADATLGGKPNQGTKKDKRLRQNKSAAVESELADATEVAPSTHVPWEGVIVVEGEKTGDGRQFALSSLSWPDPAEVPIAFQWQKETTHGGINDLVVSVGRITEIWRSGDEIWGRGFVDTGSEDGAEIARRMTPSEADPSPSLGVSIVADDPENADMEFVFPEGCPQGGPTLDDLFDPDMGERCFSPEYTIYHSGRIRALTVVDVPAFTRAKVRLATESNLAAAAAAREIFGAVAPKTTSTSDAAWDAGANESRLPSPLSISTARAAYAWIDSSRVEDGELPKAAARFIHHEVTANGTVGAANLTACSAGIGALHGARGGTTIPEADRRGVYNHLARHLRDAGQEPPPFSVADAVEQLTAAAHVIEIPDVPPVEWFQEPTEMPEIGAFTVTDEGRVYGYLAPRNVAHRGFTDRRVEVPMRNVDYSTWMNRPTIVTGGERVATGSITMDCGHADVSPFVDASAAQAHYDNSCSIVATVRIGENKRGVWVAGALLHDVTPSMVARMLACQLSGDWRPHRERPGVREFCGALLVPVPGFPMASTRASIRTDHEQLVASTVPVRWERVRNPLPAEDLPDPVAFVAALNKQKHADEARALAAELGLDRQTQVKNLAAEVLGG